MGGNALIRYLPLFYSGKLVKLPRPPDRQQVLLRESETLEHFQIAIELLRRAPRGYTAPLSRLSTA